MAPLASTHDPQALAYLVREQVLHFQVYKFLCQRLYVEAC